MTQRLADALREIERLRAEVEALKRNDARFRWLENNVTERLTDASMERHEYAEHKTQYVLPKLIAWADFCGQISFGDAIDNQMEHEAALRGEGEK